MVTNWRESWDGSDLAMVAVTEIAPHPANFRKNLTDLDALAESIAEQGLTHPLEVMPADRVAAAWPRQAEALAEYSWVLLSGHRRLAAAQRVFAADPEQTVPVVVRRDDICDEPVKQLDVIATEDSAHRSLNPIEQARAFQASIEAGRTQRQTAKQYGCAQGLVAQRLSLLRLPEELQQAVETGELGPWDARKLARLKSPDDMRAAWKLFLDQREDAWITSIDQAIAEHADRAAYQARRRTALSQADTEGLQVVDPVEEFGRDLDIHRVTDPEELVAARAATTLVAGISGNGDLEYFTTSPVTKFGVPPAGPDLGQRRAAAAARERAGRLLAAVPPPEVPAALAPMVDAFLRSAPEGWRPIARRWLRWLRLGPVADLEPVRWWEQIYAADWDTRVWAAQCLALAGSEHRARTRQEWDGADLAWVSRLVADVGYVPRPWERHRLHAAERLGERAVEGDGGREPRGAVCPPQ